MVVLLAAVVVAVAASLLDLRKLRCHQVVSSPFSQPKHELHHCPMYFLARFDVGSFPCSDVNAQPRKEVQPLIPDDLDELPSGLPNRVCSTAVLLNGKATLVSI